MLKKFLIGTFVALALMVTSTAFAAYDFGPSTLKVGSKGDYVKTLQTFVGATSDGSFGPMTKAKVVAWQSNNGLTADGLFGAMSKAKANEAQSNFPAGCTNATGFSSVTGVSCATTVSTLPAGCVAGALFSSTTGVSCSATVVTTLPAGCATTAGFSSTTGASCATGVIGTVLNSNGEGTLTLQSAPFSVTTNPAQGDSQDTVLAFALKATGSNININRVNVDITSTNSLPWSYFTNLYLYNGSTLLATLPVNSTSLTQNTFGSSYTASFQGLSSVIPAGTISSFIVKADITSTIPASNGSNNVWKFGLSDQGIRGTDGAGLSEYVGGTSANSYYAQILTVNATGSGSLQVLTDVSNPISNTIVEQSNSTVTGVTALVFDLKNTSNNTATIQSISATIGGTPATSVSAYYLYNGGTSIQSVGNPGGSALTFNNFTPFTIAPNSSAVMSIKFDASTGASGIVTVAVTGSTQVTALLNNTIASSITGSATGNNFTLISGTGVSATLVGTPTFVSGARAASVTGYSTGTFTFAVSPVGVSLADLSKAGAVVVTGTVKDVTGNTSVAMSNYIVSPVLTNGISDGNTANITVTVTTPNIGGNINFAITALQLATTAWNGSAGLVNGTNAVSVSSIANASVTGFSN